MSVLADKIEKFILHKLLEEEEENIILRRNELADELDCAPSQISYVLSTRFSNDKGFIVESRRGSGGFVRIVRLQQKKKKMDCTPVTLSERRPAVSVSMEDLDGLLFRLLKHKAKLSCFIIPSGRFLPRLMMNRSALPLLRVS